MAAARNGRWGGVKFPAPLFRYLLECGPRAGGNPRLYRVAEEPCTPFERFNLSTAPFQPGNQRVRGPIPIKIRKIIV